MDVYDAALAGEFGVGAGTRGEKKSVGDGRKA